MGNLSKLLGGLPSGKFHLQNNTQCNATVPTEDQIKNTTVSEMYHLQTFAALYVKVFTLNNTMSIGINLIIGLDDVHICYTVTLIQSYKAKTRAVV